MMKHVLMLALAISVGIAVAKMFGGTFNLAGLLGGSTTTTPTTCHLAAVAFNEDFETGPRVNRVRAWLHNDFAKSCAGARMLVNLYDEYGARAAAKVRTSRVLSAVNRIIFFRALRIADRKTV